MNVHLPTDLESFIQAIVHAEQFASIDEAMTEAARLLIREHLPPSMPAAGNESRSGLGFVAALRDDADLLDRAVEYAMRIREERTWRVEPAE